MQKEPTKKESNNPLKREINRRDFLKIALAGTITSLGCNQNYLNSKIDFATIKIPYFDLPKEFQNYRIAFVTDIHHGPFLEPSILSDTITFLKKSDFDLLILGGDYLNIPESKISKNLYPIYNEDYKKTDLISTPKKIFSEVAYLFDTVRPRDGIVAVFGNHDRWIAGDDCYRIFKKENYKFLVNQSIAIRRGDYKLSITGVDDYWTGIPNINSSNPKANFKLLVTHNPDFISQLPQENEYYFNLALCGHTHGGQIRFPIIGGFHYNVSDLRFIEGLVNIKQDQYCFTSRGLGVVEVPIRLNCPPEVNILELV